MEHPVHARCCTAARRAHAGGCATSLPFFSPRLGPSLMRGRRSRRRADVHGGAKPYAARLVWQAGGCGASTRLSAGVVSSDLRFCLAVRGMARPGVSDDMFHRSRCMSQQEIWILADSGCPRDRREEGVTARRPHAASPSAGTFGVRQSVSGQARRSRRFGAPQAHVEGRRHERCEEAAG